MLHFIKRILFKFMELALEIRPTFKLQTQNPVFINFKLSDAEAWKVQKSLPENFKLTPIAFTEQDDTPHYWISLNIYHLLYPRRELQSIIKNRLEINTFVVDDQGRKGIFVFDSSPFVSKEPRLSLLGLICDFSERLVQFIYGCGKLCQLEYVLSAEHLKIKLHNSPIQIETQDFSLSTAHENVTLSKNYIEWNDISFFNEGRTYDAVFTNSTFSQAVFKRYDAQILTKWRIKTSFLNRPPDELLVSQCSIDYLVSTLQNT